MTVEEIQRVLRTICQERSAALQDRGSHPDAADMLSALELNSFRPAPGRATLTFANFTFAQQDQIEGYGERLVEEAHGLCMRLQARCPILREGDNGELWDLERVYRAQYHAMVRLRRRCDEGLWIRAHIMKARKWIEEAYVESVN